MFNLKNAILLALLASFVFSQSRIACATLSGPSNFDIEDPLLWSPLIVRGVVTDIEQGISTLEEWGIRGAGGGTVKVETIRLRVAEVIKGNFLQDYLDAAAFAYLHGDSEAPYAIGDDVVLAVYYNASAKRYQLRNYLGLFIKGDQAWIRPPDTVTDGVDIPRTTMTLRDIEDRVRTMSNDSVVEGSELAVAGKLLAVEQRGAVGSQQVCWTLEVEVVLRGVFDANRVEFCMRNKGLLPEWAVPVPISPSVGERWVVFLRRRGDLWIPYAGVNGMFRIEGDRLLYDGTVDVGMGWGDLRRLVEAYDE